VFVAPIGQSNCALKYFSTSNRLPWRVFQSALPTPRPLGFGWFWKLRVIPVWTEPLLDFDSESVKLVDAFFIYIFFISLQRAHGSNGSSHFKVFVGIKRPKPIILPPDTLQTNKFFLLKNLQLHFWFYRAHVLDMCRPRPELASCGDAPLLAIKTPRAPV